MIAAGVGLEGEEESGQERVVDEAGAEEAEGEEQHQREPLRPQRAQVGDLVRADGREREGRAREERGGLAAAEVPGQEAGGQARENEGEEAHDVEDEDGVVREGSHGQGQERGAEDRLVEAEGVAVGMEDVGVGQRRGPGLQGVHFPTHGPGEIRRVAGVHDAQARRQRPGEREGQENVQPESAEDLHDERLTRDSPRRHKVHEERKRVQPRRSSGSPLRLFLVSFVSLW